MREKNASTSSARRTRSTRPAAPRNDIVELMCSFLTILLVCGRVHYLASRAAFHSDHPAFAKWIAVECFGLVRKSFVDRGHFAAGRSVNFGRGFYRFDRGDRFACFDGVA